MNHYSFRLKSSQKGQGLVEYAILLLLTITLVIGGAELAIATFASSKSSDAAEAGINEYVEVNEQRIKFQENINRYLERLERETLANETIVDDLDQITTDFTSGYLWRAYQENTTPGNPVVSISSLDTDADGTVNGNTDTYPELAVILNLIDGVLDGNGDGVIDSTDRDGTITSEELYHAVKYHQALIIDDKVVANEDGLNDDRFDVIQEIKALAPTSGAETEAKYYALILFEHIALSALPLDPRESLSVTVPLLADHDVGNPLFTNPSCDSSDPANIIYSHGFPGQGLDFNGDGILDDGVPHQDIDGVNYPAIYLFNPLPIDVATCQGADPARDDASQLSVLVGGYGNPGRISDLGTYTPGLPKLNQAYYSQYTRICLDGSDEYVGCGSASVSTEVLKPPGKYCLTDSTSDTVDSCPNIDTDYLETSGYYFWGRGNDADPETGEQFQWIYGSSSTPEFRPSFQLLCNGESHQSGLIVGDECAEAFDSDGDGVNFGSGDDPITSIHTVEVNVRYRSVFESFLAFGMQELQDEALVHYFYDPSNLRALGGKSGIPTAGSELGPKQGALPTVKPFKDFRGCYEVNVETNQVSACN